MSLLGSALSNILGMTTNLSLPARSGSTQNNANPFLGLLNNASGSSTDFTNFLKDDKPARSKSVASHAKSSAKAEAEAFDGNYSDDTADVASTKSVKAAKANAANDDDSVDASKVNGDTTASSTAVSDEVVTGGAPATARVLDNTKLQQDLDRGLVAQSKNPGSAGGYGDAAAVGSWVLEALTGKSPTLEAQQAAMKDILENGSAAFIDKTLASKESKDYFRKADGTVDTSKANLESIRTLAHQHGDAVFNRKPAVAANAAPAATPAAATAAATPAQPVVQTPEVDATLND